MKMVGVLILVGVVGTVPKDLQKDRRKNWDHPNDRIIEIGLNTRESHGERLIETGLKNSQEVKE